MGFISSDSTGARVQGLRNFGLRFANNNRTGNRPAPPPAPRNDTTTYPGAAPSKMRVTQQDIDARIGVPNNNRNLNISVNPGVTQ